MEEFRGLTAEMYQAIVAIVDDRLREVRVSREGFDRLEGAIARLAEAQTRTEERVGHQSARRLNGVPLPCAICHTETEPFFFVAIALLLAISYVPALTIRF